VVILKMFLTQRASLMWPTIDGIKQMAIKREMCDPPTSEEVMTALSRIKPQKIAGSNGLLLDIVKCCGGPFS